MQLEIIILSEGSQKDKGKYNMISLIVESKIWHKRTYLQSSNRLIDIENRLVVAKGKVGGGGLGEGWAGIWGLVDANYYI